MTELNQDQRESAWEAMIELKRRLDNPEPELTAASGWCAPSTYTFLTEADAIAGRF